MYAHNSYVQMAAESGVLGIGLYLAFLAAVLFRIARSVLRAEESFPKLAALALFSGAAGLLVNALFESLLQSTQLRTLFWSILGVAAGLACQRLRPKEAARA
jgi:O-antigen ligase